MALSGKLIGYVEISKTGDVFHDLYRHNPHKIVKITPHKVHDCELHEGDRGVVGSIISWHYTHELGELYKSFTIIFHVEPKGDGQKFTWTFEFEKPDTSVPYPTSMMDYLCNLVKDLDAHNSDH
ncbi:putative Bet v I/Major latex protein [Helianthus annuus]|nr:putative Bet v I/Major latex protein [Helianthus annuus]